MEPIFYIQLATSFLVGGGLIAALSIIAEKSPSRTAGVIISLPSTIAISFIFISWVTGPQSIKEVTEIVPISMGAVLPFAIIYLYLSKIQLPKALSMLICMSLALGSWLAFAFWLAQFSLRNIWLASLIYLGFVAVGYFFLTYLPKTKSKASKTEYTLLEKLIRAGFAGFIITLAVYLSKVSGPVWGGILSGFPAVYTSSLLILHFHHDSDFLFRTFKTAPLGFITSLIFILVSHYSFPALGTALGFAGAYGAALLFFLIVIRRK